VKSRRVLIISIVLNLALLTVVFAIFSRVPPENGIQLPSQPRKAPIPPRRVETVERTVATVITNTLSLDWRALESEDYRQYIQNLRAVHCPEETVHDIIIADVNKLYANRWQALAVPKDWKYWMGEEAVFNNTRLQKQRQALEKERDELLKELLGIDYQKEVRKLSFWIVDDRDNKLAFLPETKRDQVKRILDKYQQLQNDLYRDKGPGVVDPKKTRELRNQEAGELAQTLTSDELENYQLRFSPWSNGMRQGLYGVNITEDEFKNLFRRSKALRDELDQLDYESNRAAAMARNVELSKQLSIQAKEILGEQRYEEYERSRNSDFQDTVRLTSQFDLPRETAVKVYEIKKAYNNASLKLHADQTFTPERRAEIKQMMKAEAEKVLSTTLGEEAYKAYNRQASYWLR
jgi:hypothetical protein